METLFLPGEKFGVEVQEGALGVYQWDRKQAKHYFCRNCGISTFSETTRRPGQYIVNLGCVEVLDTFALETTVFDGKRRL